MGATNSTIHYNMSQFIGTDKPSWLQDYNGDMTTIDTAIYNAKVAADSAQNTADSNTTAIGINSNDISALQSTVGGHTSDITDLAGDVNTIESLIGNGTPTAGDHTLIGAINTNSNSIDTLNNKLTTQAIQLETSHLKSTKNNVLYVNNKLAELNLYGTTDKELSSGVVYSISSLNIDYYIKGDAKDVVTLTSSGHRVRVNTSSNSLNLIPFDTIPIDTYFNLVVIWMID